MSRIVPAVLVAAAVALLTAAVAASDPGGCRTLAGDFTAVAPADCSSPVGICTHGTLTGGLASVYDFTADTLVPTGNPGELAYTGHSTVTTTQGAVIAGSDTGVMQLRPDGTAAFVTTVHVVGGTRQYAHATGAIVAPGVLDLATGDTVGTYSATVCLGVGAG